MSASAIARTRWRPTPARKPNHVDVVKSVDAATTIISKTSRSSVTLRQAEASSMPAAAIMIPSRVCGKDASSNSRLEPSTSASASARASTSRPGPHNTSRSPTTQALTVLAHTVLVLTFARLCASRRAASQAAGVGSYEGVQPKNYRSLF